jgi:hypothetical protein
MYKVPRKDRTIKAICRMLKAWAIAIGENLRLPEEIVAEVFLELRGCRDIEGIRKVLVKEDRKWLRDELQVLLEDEKFLCYAISENPHITHEDKTLLWEKLSGYEGDGRNSDESDRKLGSKANRPVGQL